MQISDEMSTSRAQPLSRPLLRGVWRSVPPGLAARLRWVWFRPGSRSAFRLLCAAVLMGGAGVLLDAAFPGVGWWRRSRSRSTSRSCVAVASARGSSSGWPSASASSSRSCDGRASTSVQLRGLRWQLPRRYSWPRSVRWSPSPSGGSGRWPCGCRPWLACGLAKRPYVQGYRSVAFHGGGSPFPKRMHPISG